MSLHRTAQVHPTAIIHPDANLGANVIIGPFCIIEKDVTIGRGTVVKSHVVIESHTQIGADCTVFSHATIGGLPKDLKFRGDKSYVKIGDRNVIREYVNICRSAARGKSTIIGSDNLLMAYVNIAHDCKIGSNVIMANMVTLAGHVQIDDNTIAGALSVIHQFARIGRFAILGAGSKLSQDLPPFMMADGHPAALQGINSVGMRRNRFTASSRSELKQAFKILARSRLAIPEAIKRIVKLGKNDTLKQLIKFIKDSKRGICI